MSAGEHGIVSSISGFGNAANPLYSNANSQQLPTDANYSHEIEMPDCPFGRAASASKHPRTSKHWFPERRKIYYRSTEHEGGWTHVNSSKSSFYQQVVNGLKKKKFRAKVIADCKVQQYEECRKEIEGLANQEFERMTREHAAQVDSQRILAEKAIRDSQRDRADLLEKIRSLEQAKKAVECESKKKDQQIRNLKTDLHQQNIATERAVRNAQAKSENKSKIIMDLKEEKASLMEQFGNVRNDLRVTTVKIENLQRTLRERPTHTQQANVIRNLTSNNERLRLVVAEQAQTLVDYKNSNNDMMQEISDRKSENASLEEKITSLRKKLLVQRRLMLKEGIQVVVNDDTEADSAAVDADLEFFTETGPSTTTAEISTSSPSSSSTAAAVTSKDKPTVPTLSAKSSTTTTLVTTPPPQAAVKSASSAPAPSASWSAREILGNLILLAYCFYFGNPIFFTGLLSLLISSRTNILLSFSAWRSDSDEINDDNLSALDTTGTNTDTEDRKFASMPSG